MTTVSNYTKMIANKPSLNSYNYVTRIFILILLIMAMTSFIVIAIHLRYRLRGATQPVTRMVVQVKRLAPFFIQVCMLNSQNSWEKTINKLIARWYNLNLWQEKLIYLSLRKCNVRFDSLLKTFGLVWVLSNLSSDDVKQRFQN